MKAKALLITSALIAALAIALGIRFGYTPTSEELKTSGAGLAIEQWFFQRSYPFETMYMDAFSRAFSQHQRLGQESTRSAAYWERLGPENIGGRTLALAFNLQNPNTIWAGSASGGLWRTHTAGTGPNAWERVPTGFPVLGVMDIVVAPNDSNTIYIGTGEVYGYQSASPGVAIRTTRGTYGIGILKSTDNGQSWTKSLDWSLQDLRGVHDLVINPLRPETVFAATTEGLYRTRNAGQSWELIHNVLMATDVDIDPADTARIYVCHGNFGSAGHGIYRSDDGGATFNKLTNGLPTSFTGMARVATSVSQSGRIYASVANTFDQIGLYRSDDHGNFWTLVNTEDVAKYQGWYSHDLAVDPTNPDLVFFSGIDGWKSVDGGQSLTQKSYWYLWDFGITPVGGPEGPPDYVHADMHRVYFHPSDPNQIFLATDGGIFFSGDKGETFEGRNGGYVTTQFYANFANSATDSAVALGGMQDNATAIYLGGPAWKRVIGGDGLSSAVDPRNDQVMYGSYQYLGMARSYNRFDSLQFIIPPGNQSETNFAGPFEISPANPDVLFAGRNLLYRSPNQGGNWSPTSTLPPDGLNPILTIALTAEDPDLIYISTSPNQSPPAKVFRSTNGGSSWNDISAGLPDRICMDIAIHPLDKSVVYAVFSGFGTPHVYKSVNGGNNWVSVSNALPDVPTNTVVIDPQNPDYIYVGNDLGVYFSPNGGQSWSQWSTGLPDAALVMHLSISPANRKLRVATHGNGVWQAPLEEPAVSSIQDQFRNGWIGLPYPNPARKAINLDLKLEQGITCKISLLSLEGRVLHTWPVRRVAAGSSTIQLKIPETSPGRYFLKLESSEGQIHRQIQLLP